MIPDALFEMAVGETPSREVLDDFVRRYPEHAAELAELAVELTVEAMPSEDTPPPPDTDGPSPGAWRALEKFRELVRRSEAAAVEDGILIETP